MKSKQIKVMFFLLTLVSALIFRSSEAQQSTSICTPKQVAPIDNVRGCVYAVKLAADSDTRWLSRDCCKAVKRLPDCLLLVAPDRAYHTSIFKSICFVKFHESIL